MVQWWLVNFTLAATEIIFSRVLPSFGVRVRAYCMSGIIKITTCETFSRT